MPVWLLTSAALLVLGLFLLLAARRSRSLAGLPPGRLVYDDTRGGNRPETPLYSSKLRLTGKPDYLVAEGRDVIPVEVKSGRRPPRPYLSHVLQLVAYCLLIEAAYGQRPTHGIVKYQDGSVEVEYTDALRDETLAAMRRMRADLAAGATQRNHNEAGRCRSCGYFRNCDQRIK